MRNHFHRGAWRRTLALTAGVIAAGLAGPAIGADDPLRIEPARRVAEKAHTSDLPQLARGPTSAYMAYYTPGDSANQLRLTDLSTPGPGDLVYQLPAGGNKMSDIGFATAGETRYVLWRPKFAQRKDVFFARSEKPGAPFSEPLVVNQDHNALPPTLLQAGSDGLVVAMWHDERHRNPDVYLNISRDGGRSFAASDIQLSRGYEGARSPALLVAGQEIHTFFVGRTAQNQRPSRPERAVDRTAGRDAKQARKGATKPGSEIELYLVHRYSLDGGQTWKENRLAKTNPSTAAGMFTPVRMAGGRLWLFYREGAEVLKGVYSDDRGQSWKSGVLPRLKDGEYVVTLSTATAKDSLYLAYTNSFPGQPTAKPDAYLLIGRDQGDRWEAPRRLSTEPHRLTMNTSPEVAADASGRVVAVWTDLRNIRASTYVTWSTDFGASFAPERPLEEPGRFNSRYPKLLDYGDGRYDAVYLRFNSDRTADAGMWAARFTLAGPKAAPAK